MNLLFELLLVLLFTLSGRFFLKRKFPMATKEVLLFPQKRKGVHI